MFGAIIFLICAIPIVILVEKHRKKYIADEIKKGTEEKLKGNDYKVRIPIQYGTPMCYTTYNSIKRGIDKNIEEIQKSQEPK